MNQTDTLFTEPKAAEILELAARYYDAENRTYTETELISAGSEVQIPDRLIRRAIADLKIRQQRQLERQRKTKHYFKITAGISLILTIAIACWSGVTYNHLVAVATRVKTAQKQVDNQHQRRADLIPQLIDLTNSYAERQQEIISQLVKARQEYLQAEDTAAKTEATAKLDRAILNFSQYATTNPQLNSSQLFINLQYEITGTANRLAVERMRYNQAVQNYNQEIQQFPQSSIAEIFGFESLSPKL